MMALPLNAIAPSKASIKPLAMEGLREGAGLLMKGAYPK
jgi:hypothetical protein